MKFLKDICKFIVLRKKYWLIPLLTAILVLACIIIAIETAPVIPMMYPIF